MRVLKSIDQRFVLQLRRRSQIEARLLGSYRLRCVLGLPHIRQELPQFLGWRCADLGQDAGEVALRVDGVPFATGSRKRDGFAFPQFLIGLLSDDC